MKLLSELRLSERVPKTAALCLLCSALFAQLVDSAQVFAQTPNEGARAILDDYKRAEQFLPQKLVAEVKNATVKPFWIGESDQFWYRRDTEAGKEFVIVDPITGERNPAFDHREIAKSLKKLTGKDVNPHALPFSHIKFTKARTAIEFQMGPKSISCDLSTNACEYKAKSHQTAGELISPDEKKVLFLRDDNLWIRDTVTQVETALTNDGEDYFAYGKWPDLNLLEIPRRKYNFSWPPLGTAWSPNSTHIISLRIDEREIQDLPYIEWAPADGGPRPVQHSLKIPLLGEPGHTKRHLHILDVNSGSKTLVTLPEKLSRPLLQFGSDIWWSRSGRHAYTLALSADGRSGGLIEIDVEQAKIRTIIEETSETYFDFNPEIYRTANVRVLPDLNRVIWYSQRDGWGHLYLYDLQSGELINRITEGAWPVREIVHVDVKTQSIFFMGSGRERGEDPYFRQLYRVGFDGSDLRLLTPEDAEHDISSPPKGFVALFLNQLSATSSHVSPSGKFVVDNYSRVDQETRSVLRQLSDGKILMELETANAEALSAMGWRAPVPFVSKAADGETDIYGLLFLPSNFDPKRRYPVVEKIYGGPQTMATPKTFSDVLSEGMNNIVELGFVGVMLDSRGTPGRSKAFQDHTFGKNFGDWGLEDHVAAIRQLSDVYPAMDTQRVGIYGHSYGGYGSARAILLYPDFYKVAVSSAGPHTIYGGYGGPKYTPVPIYEDGSNIQPDRSKIPENYWQFSNNSMAQNLKGNLMLAYGDIDENVPPSMTLQFAASLIEANKDFELVYLPNRNHGFFFDPYFVKRRWDYFVRHLQQTEPPSNFVLGRK